MYDVEIKINYRVKHAAQAKHIIKLFNRLYRKIPILFDCADVKKTTNIRPVPKS